MKRVHANVGARALARRNGVTVLTLPISTSTGTYVVSYTGAGVVRWAVPVVPGVTSNGSGIVTGSDGIYVCGSYNSAAIIPLRNADGTSSGKSLPSSGFYDAFIIKYSTLGVVQWATTVRGTGYDVGASVAIDATGVYLTGGYNSGAAVVTLLNGDGSGSGKTMPKTPAGMCMYIIKYNTSGVVQWATGIVDSASVDSNQAYSIATDSTGVYAVGYYTNPTTVFPLLNGDGSGSGKSLPITSGFWDVFIIKYSTLGVVQWATTVPGSGGDYGRAVATYSNGVYIAGSYGSSGAATPLLNGDGTSSGKSLTATSAGVFIIKYNTTGVIQWAADFDGTGGEDEARGLAVDATGVYVTGYANGSAILRNSDGSDSTLRLPTTGGYQATFIISYSTAGNLNWATTIPCTSGSSMGVDIVLDPTGFYVTGYYDSPSAIISLKNSDGSTSTKKLPASLGASDIFIVKYDPGGFVQWAVSIQGSADDRAYHITTDSTNIYTTGYYVSTSAVPLLNAS